MAAEAQGADAVETLMQLDARFGEDFAAPGADALVEALCAEGALEAAAPTPSR